MGSVNVVARRQTLVQLTDALLARLDERAARLRRTPSSLIREAYLSDQLEAEVDRHIVEGYTRVPQDAQELRWAWASAHDAIREEAW